MLQYTCNDEGNELFLLNKNVFDTSLVLIKNTGKLKSLGQYQLDILMKGIIEYYSFTEIERCDGNKISSSVLYDSFINSVKTYGLYENLVNYISCVKFVNYFGKKYEQNRTSEGKSWKDIKLKKTITDFFNPIYFGTAYSKRTQFIHNNLDKLNYNLDLFEKCKSWYQGSEIDCDELIYLNTQNHIP
jgi:hypothetical protein